MKYRCSLRKTPIALTLASILIAFFCSGLQAIDIHMAVNGSNDSGDGSRGNPFEGLQRCLAIATPGDTIYIHEGTYWNEPRSGGYVIQGEPDAWIVITGAPGEEKPLFRGTSNMYIWDGWDKGDSHHFILKDIKFNMPDCYHTININDGGTDEQFKHVLDGPCHNFIFDGLEFYRTAEVAQYIKMAGCDTFVVQNCYFNGHGDRHNIAIDAVGCHYGVYRYNRVDSCLQGGFKLKGGCSDIIIQNNYFNHVAYTAINMGGDTWWEFTRPPIHLMEEPTYECRRVYAFSNYLLDVHVPISFNTCYGCKVYNNIIVRTDNTKCDPGDTPPPAPASNLGLVWVRHKSEWCPNPSRDCELSNNIFYFNDREDGYDNVVWRCSDWNDEATYSATFVFRNNLWYNFDDPANSETRWNWQCGHEVDMPQVSGNSYVDPQLWVDPVLYIHRPALDSPAKNAGVHVVPPAIAHPEYRYIDYVNNTYGSPPSMGAIAIGSEHTAPPSQNNTLRIWWPPKD